MNTETLASFPEFDAEICPWQCIFLPTVGNSNRHPTFDFTASPAVCAMYIHSIRYSELHNVPNKRLP